MIKTTMSSLSFGSKQNLNAVVKGQQMTQRIEYTQGATHVALVDNSKYESDSPFWVYYNNKLACRFYDERDARMYIKCILRDGKLLSSY